MVQLRIYLVMMCTLRGHPQDPAGLRKVPTDFHSLVFMEKAAPDSPIGGNCPRARSNPCRSVGSIGNVMSAQCRLTNASETYGNWFDLNDSGLVKRLTPQWVIALALCTGADLTARSIKNLHARWTQPLHRLTCYNSNSMLMTAMANPSCCDRNIFIMLLKPHLVSNNGTKCSSLSRASIGKSLRRKRFFIVYAAASALPDYNFAFLASGAVSSPSHVPPVNNIASWGFMPAV